MSKQDEVQKKTQDKRENARWAIKKKQSCSKERRYNPPLARAEGGGQARPCQGQRWEDTRV